MFPFFIQKQREKLSKYAEHVAKKIKDNQVGTFAQREEAGQALNSVAFTFIKYREALRDHGKFDSYLPWKETFKRRIECAKAIDKAFLALKETERNIKFNPAINKPVINTPLRRTKSEEAATLPKVYPSPIKRSKSTNDSSIKQINQIAIRPTKYLH